MPLLGIGMSCFYAIGLYCRNRVWSRFTILYTLLPVIIMMVVYFVLRWLIQFKWNGIMIKSGCVYKRIFLIGGVGIILLNMLLWKDKKVELDYMDFEQIVQKNNSGKESSYFVIYSSDNGMCYKMTDIYKQAVLESDPREIYFVDMTYEKVLQDNVRINNIDAFPSLVFYYNGEEIERLEGAAKIEDINRFLQKYEKR